MKRAFKGPWLWIVLAVAGVLLALQFLAPGGGQDEISTSRMEQYIADGQVKEITLVDGEQQIQAVLDDDVERDGGNEVVAYYVQGQQEGIIRAIDAQSRPARSTPPPPRTPSPRSSDRCCSRCCRSC